MRPVPGAWLEASLEGEDAFPPNDASFALLPPVEDARVAIIGPPNHYLDRALEVMPELEVIHYAPGKEPPALPADLALFDRASPRPPLTIPSLHFAPPQGWAAGARVIHPKVVRWALEHPVFSGVSLRALQIEEATILDPPDVGRVLASTAEGPILVADDRGPGAVVVGFDLLRSDLPLTVAFPELLYNAILWARATPVPPAPAVAGEPLVLDGYTIVERLDDGSTDLVTGEARLAPGPYRLTAPSGARLVAVVPDPREFGSPVAGEPAPRLTTEAPAHEASPIRWVALLAAAILLVEFLVAPL
jgi:hypothetical protein